MIERERESGINYAEELRLACWDGVRDSDDSIEVNRKRLVRIALFGYSLFYINISQTNQILRLFLIANVAGGRTSVPTQYE